MRTLIRRAGRAGLITLLSCMASGQTLPAIPAFEVASIKVHEAGGGTVGLSVSGRRLTAEAKTITGLIMYAYNLKIYEVPETPALAPFGDIFYDIAARAEGILAPSTDDFRQMLQVLLMERFKLKVHRETREIPVYALVAGRNGPKFRESLPGTEPAVRFAAMGRNYQVAMRSASMADLIRVIENSLVDRPALDRTGLTGAYELNMTVTDNTPPNRRSADPDDISIFAAVETLGLSLHAEKAAVNLIVVDHVEKPSAN